MLKQLIQAVKENPLETALDMIAVIAIFAFGYVLLLLGAIITNNILKLTDGTVKKSIETVLFMWFFKKALHV